MGFLITTYRYDGVNYPLDWGIPEEKLKVERLLLGADVTILLGGHSYQSRGAAARKMKSEAEENLPAGLRFASAPSQALRCPRGAS